MRVVESSPYELSPHQVYGQCDGTATYRYEDAKSGQFLVRWGNFGGPSSDIGFLSIHGDVFFSWLDMQGWAPTIYVL